MTYKLPRGHPGRTEAPPGGGWYCKSCGRRRRIYEDLDNGGYCGDCAPWDYGETGGAGSEERGKTMSDVWRLTVDDDVQESSSFTPLEAIIKKLISRRKPFKVGFGKLIEEEIPPTGTAPRAGRA